MPLQATSGAASYDAFGGGVPVVPNYIEDVFSTYLYTGTGAAQTITNGIDLSTKGGLVWTKYRNDGYWHTWFDTVRGNTKVLYSNSTSGQDTLTNTITSFNSTGYTLGVDSNGGNNTSGGNFVSWTFRKQPKFFDVVTFTTDVNGYALVSHNLGSTPAFVITKTTSSGGSDWACYHKDLNGGVNAGRYIIRLNKTDAADNPVGANNWIVPTSTTLEFPAGIWLSGNTTYVAYVFASNAGGFGLTGTDNVISCGSFDATSAGSVTLGYEPQWVLIKASNDVGSWHIQDNMRGYTTSGNNPTLDPDRSVAEFSGGYTNPTATGFKYGSLGSSFIYIAIRRGPMKVPTVGTSVYQGITRTGTGSAATITGTSFPPDLFIGRSRVAGGFATTIDRLRGNTKSLETDSTSAEFTSTSTQDCTSFNMNGVSVGTSQNTSFNNSGEAAINWFFARAPSFFDEVCYTGTGSNPLVLNHNLGIAPTTIIIKRRSAAASNNNWYCGVNMNASTYTEILLNSDGGGAVYSYPNWFVSAPTSTTFDLNGGGNVNQSGATYVAYLFATCPGVSKVGTYTGNGTTQTIDCGFGAGGVRFVLIKRTDSTGDWYTYDTARGMTVLTDPYLFLNTTDAEVATLGSVTTVSTGFALNSSILAAINISAGTYTFLAIA
jgi:hypothetical protein